MTKYDWSIHNEYSESTCFCQCGAIYRSHAKILMTEKPHLISRKPCPACQHTDLLTQISSDPEMYTISKSVKP